MSVERDTIREVTYAEKTRIKEIVARGRHVLEGSNLVSSEQALTGEDVVATRRLLETVAPITSETARLYQHLQLTAKVARKIGKTLQEADPEQYGDINLDELEILGLLHDSGRFITHRWLRNEILERNMLRRLGVREDVIKKIPSVDMYVGKDSNNQDEVISTIKNMSIQERIIEMADIYGKRKTDGGILAFNDVMDFHYASRKNYEGYSGKKSLFPSEAKLDLGVVDFSAKVYEGLHDFFFQKGVDLESIRQDILKEESTTPIRAIIFDAGGVLFANPDAELLRKVQEHFGMTQEATMTLWKKLITQLQKGATIITASKFWEQFAAGAGQQKPSSQDQEVLKEKINFIPQRDPAMTEIIEALKQEDYSLAILSDTIPLHEKAMKDGGIFKGFDTVVTSPQIMTTKSTEETDGYNSAYQIAALRLWLPPQACFFVDDRQDYVERAEEIGMQGVTFQSSQQLREELTRRELLVA